MDNFEPGSDAVRRHLESHSSVFQTWSKRVRLLVRTHLASRSNAFGFSFEPVWLFIRTRLASHSNTFSFSFERFSYNDWTHPGCGANAFIRGANTFGQKNALYLVSTGTIYHVPASINFDHFELFIDRQHYFSSFKLLRHSSHFAKILFNRQHDYCACAIKPRLRSDNQGFI